MRKVSSVMKDPDRDGADLASSQPRPASSPLSSIGDVELSDPEAFEAQYLASTGPDVGAQLRTTDAVDSRSAEDAKQPTQLKYSPRTGLDESEDELAGEPVSNDLVDNSADPGEDVKDIASGQEEPSNEPTTRRMPRRQKKVVWKQPPKKVAKKSVWTAERLLTDSKSPLAKADIRSIVTNPMAWDILDAESKAEILALFPRKSMILEAGTENARPDIAAMMNDDTLRGDCAEYAENIAQGRHDHDWLVSAYHAHERRSVGEFDEYLVQKVYDDWGTELPEDFKPRREPRSAKRLVQTDSNEGEAINGETQNEAHGNGLARPEEATDQGTVKASHA